MGRSSFRDRFVVVLALVLMVLPVCAVVLNAFATEWSGTILPAGFTLQWFDRVVGDPAGQHRPIRLQSLAHGLQTEVIQPSERGQVRASEGSVRHVEVFRMGGVRTSIIGRPRPLSDERRADADARVYTTTSTPWIRKSPISL